MNAENSFSTPDHAQFPAHLLSSRNLVERLNGEHDYDILVGIMTRFRPAVIVRQLVSHFPADFDAVAQSLDQVAFHVLRVAGDFNVFCLADPQFDPVEAICLLLETEEARESVEADLISSAIDVSETFTAITAAVQTLTPDQGKALWACVAYGQNAELTDFEILAAPWWTAGFIGQQFTEN
jgi:hypothetical protein